MLLDPRALELLALAAATAAVLALVLCVVLLRRLRRLTAAPAPRRDVEVLRDDVSAARGDLSDGLRHVAVVRYDAFGDQGGRMSFSLALLDDAGDGVVVTGINGRSEARTYAKGVSGGSSEHPLSPEETEAVERASRGPQA